MGKIKVTIVRLNDNELIVNFGKRISRTRENMSVHLIESIL